MQEASGSIPLISSKRPETAWFQTFSFSSRSRPLSLPVGHCPDSAAANASPLLCFGHSNGITLLSAAAVGKERPHGAKMSAGNQ